MVFPLGKLRDGGTKVNIHTGVALVGVILVSVQNIGITGAGSERHVSPHTPVSLVEHLDIVGIVEAIIGMHGSDENAEEGSEKAGKKERQCQSLKSTQGEKRVVWSGSELHRFLP